MALITRRLCADFPCRLCAVHKDFSIASKASSPFVLSRKASTASGTGRYSRQQLDDIVATANRDGFALMPEFIPRQKINTLRKSIEPYLKARISRGQPDRGPQRFYMTPPFQLPFADESIFANQDLLYVVEGLVGADPVMCQWATDTPLNGSDYQEIHRDTSPLFGEWIPEPPSYQLAVNFSLSDCTRPVDGPLEVARATHRLTMDEGESMKARGDIQLEPVFMRAGDVLVRDVRGLHRGTPNKTDTPRIMVVIGYSRHWLRRPEVSVVIPRSVHDMLGDVAKRLLRYEPVVDDRDLGEYDGSESYDSSTLRKTSGTSFKGSS